MSELVDAAVHMIRPTLDDLPHWPLPDGYRLRPYREGDSVTWVELHLDAEPLFQVTPAHFMASYGDHLEALADRMFFVQSGAGDDVGTITAWWEDDWHGRGAWGRIHWVVVARAHQRRGLAKPMVALALQRLARDHHRAMLGTSTLRPWAIKSYLDCGFAPDPAERNDPSVVHGWCALQTLLKAPAIDEWLGT